MSDLVGNPEDRFSRVAAHIKTVYVVVGAVVYSLACWVQILLACGSGRPSKVTGRLCPGSLVSSL